MQNHCRRGVGSSYWVDRMLDYKNNPKEEIYFADIIFVESAVNDEVYDHDFTTEDRYNMDGDPVMQETEMLIRLLMLLPKKPYLIWVGASSKSRVPPKSIESQLAVTIPYMVPHIDIVHSFIPMITPLQQYWFDNIYKCDYQGHLTNTGSRILAFFVFTFLNQLTNLKSVDKKEYPNLKECKITEDPIGKNESCQINGQNIRLNRPLFISESRSRIFENSSPPHTIDFREREIKLSNESDKTESKGFSHFADRSNKYGYIGFNESDYFIVCFTPKCDVKAHSQTRQIVIEYLSSYENIGKMLITISSSPINLTPIPLQSNRGPNWLGLGSGNQCNTKEMTQTISKTIDCKHDIRVSVTTTTQLEVIQKDNHCLFVKIAVIKDDSRSLNKIKIMQITSF
jgi:hypothetical protein